MLSPMNNMKTMNDHLMLNEGVDRRVTCSTQRIRMPWSWFAIDHQYTPKVSIYIYIYHTYGSYGLSQPPNTSIMWLGNSYLDLPQRKPWKIERIYPPVMAIPQSWWLSHWEHAKNIQKSSSANLRCGWETLIRKLLGYGFNRHKTS